MILCPENSNMLFPLILPSLNASSFLNTTVNNTTLLDPNPPDTWTCNKFYARNGPPDTPTCMRLVNSLPQGSEPMRYYIHPSTAEQRRHQLPIIVGRREYRQPNILYAG